MELTRQSISSDILAFEQRIQVAWDKLTAMPMRKYEGRKDRTTRAALISEVEHVTRLVQYAEQALAELVKGESV
jgi:hypothetical protein